MRIEIRGQPDKIVRRIFRCMSRSEVEFRTTKWLQILPKDPFPHAIFDATFVALFNATFVAPQVASLHRACKLAAILERFLCDLSPQYRAYFERVRNLMQLDRGFFAANIVP